METLKKLAGAISSFAPTLAAMLGGPLAGTAVTALENAFGLAPGSGADGITQMIQNGAVTPEIIAAVRATDQKHEETLKQQQIDIIKLNADHEESMRQADSADLETVNKTMQAEVSTRAFGWRDLWGWVSGICFGFVSLLVGYIVVMSINSNEPQLMDKIPAIMGAFIPLFGIAQVILGVLAGVEAHHQGIVDRLSAGEQRVVKL